MLLKSRTQGVAHASEKPNRYLGMLVKNLSLNDARCGLESLHWDLLMQVTNLKTETCSGWWEIWYGDMVKMMTNLTLRLTLGRTLTLSEKKNLHWVLLMLVKTLEWDLLMLVKHLRLTQCGWKIPHCNLHMVVKTLHWLMLVTNFTRYLLMLVTKLILEHTYSMRMRNLTPNLVHAGIKTYTRTCCCWRPLLWNVLVLWETLQIELLLLVKNLTLRPTNYGDKPYTDALMVVTNLSLGFSHASEKLYIEIYLWWWETLHLRLAHGDDKPFTGTSYCWWPTLLNICMK